MRIRQASRRGVGASNEDRLGAGADWAFVLDGATAPSGVASGCVHDVSWLVDRLAEALRVTLGTPMPLPDALAVAIERVRYAHGGICDLDNPDSPSATVALARRCAGGFDYLVLADTAVVFTQEDGTVRAVSDDRVDRLPGGRPYSRQLVRESRNAPGGFWVASTAPEAAYEALVGTVRTSEFALMSDGCTRLVDYYGHSWEKVWNHLRVHGPHSLVDWVRAEEERNGVTLGKLHDDATVLHAMFAPDQTRRLARTAH
ncbi:protein phosphatase 2C domain-containing protein [Thermobifida halotolerans]|uniref:Protein phosphatase 2C domain-containing protein n=1 Tax=Thermobifida halotolerans TaxID=483545 RepID=A0AA97LU84_9ACTN|nr:protein phosphatase 2C domain-containing protein [Thermobifida halotolerans]UOE18154.1 protein phosphatase 2C domain-containing protein [Thermobifida halotolerans]